MGNAIKFKNSFNVVLSFPPNDESRILSKTNHKYDIVLQCQILNLSGTDNHRMLMLKRDGVTNQRRNSTF